MNEDQGQESLHHHFKSGSRHVGDVACMSSDGRGIIKSRGQVLFANGVVTGDRVAFAPNLSVKPCEADNPKVLKLSVHRCEHPCRHAKECPGSRWGILSYQQQLKEKTELVRRVMRGVTDEAGVQDIVPSPQPWGYRNRLTLQVRREEHGGAELGYATKARGEGFTPIRKCLLATEPVTQAVAHAIWVLRDMRELGKVLLPDRISFFETAAGTGALAIFKGWPKETDVQNFLELARKIELPGGIWAATANQAGIVGERGMFWREEECRAMQADWLGHKLEVHPAAFTQANQSAFAHVLEDLHSQANEIGRDAIWDLYGGYGALGFAAAAGGSRVHVVEQNGLAKSTFEQLRILSPSIEGKFVHGEVAALLPDLMNRMAANDVVILDPPRNGCHPKVLTMLGESHVRRVVYLSCNPARLARDMKILSRTGFQVNSVQPIDFFPQTPEIEVLATAIR